MSQQDILDYLKKHKGWHTAKELIKALHSNHSSMILALRKLKKWNFLEFKYHDKKGYLYKHLNNKE